jgi:biopolymer transport protein ExbD
MAHGKFQRRRPIAEMNLIPLIDVSLILVIIFMVLTPVLVQHQLTVKLPQAAQGDPGDAQTAISIQINRLGGISLDGKPVKAEKLENELMLVSGRSKSKTVLVSADKAVPIEKVVFVLDIAKKLKIGSLGIGVLKEER